MDKTFPNHTPHRLQRLRRPLYSAREEWILLMGNLVIVAWFF